MTQTSQQRAVVNHRLRLARQGIGRYEVRGLERDKELLRKLAKRLTADDQDAARLRADLLKHLSEEPPSGGGIWAALRRSPAVGANLDLSREVVPERDIIFDPLSSRYEHRQRGAEASPLRGNR